MILPMGSFLRLWVVCLTIGFGSSIIGCGNGNVSDRPICLALDVATTQDFLDNNNTAVFHQLDNDQDSFIFTSPLTLNPFDGQNVIELTFARVDFDFEDELVDVFDPGGFWARWKIVMVPFDNVTFQRFLDADTGQEKQDLLDDLITFDTRIETQLCGPFLRNGCEWGDTNEIGTQTLGYTNFGIYDWDYYPGVDRILGIVWEGDEGVQDDFITALDISMNAGPVVLEEAGRYRIELTSLANVAVP